jgi:hypothetical protein
MGVGSWELGDGRWEMGDRRWEMGDRRWEMGDGRWEMGDRRWEIGGSGGRSSEIGVLPELVEGRDGESESRSGESRSV